MIQIHIIQLLKPTAFSPKPQGSAPLLGKVLDSAGRSGEDATAQKRSSNRGVHPQSKGVEVKCWDTLKSLAQKLKKCSLIDQLILVVDLCPESLGYPSRLSQTQHPEEQETGSTDLLIAPSYPSTVDSKTVTKAPLWGVPLYSTHSGSPFSIRISDWRCAKSSDSQKTNYRPEGACKHLQTTSPVMFLVCYFLRLCPQAVPSLYNHDSKGRVYASKCIPTSSLPSRDTCSKQGSTEKGKVPLNTLKWTKLGISKSLWFLLAFCHLPAGSDGSLENRPKIPHVSSKGDEVGWQGSTYSRICSC